MKEQKQDYSWQCNIQTRVQVLQMLISYVQQSMQKREEGQRNQLNAIY